MQHEQECCVRALQAMEQRQQVAAAQEKAIADEANKRHKAAHRQQLLDEHATRACQQKAAALRQRLRLLSRGGNDKITKNILLPFWLFFTWDP